jgi:hypothetical protein
MRGTTAQDTGLDAQAPVSPEGVRTSMDWPELADVLAAGLARAAAALDLEQAVRGLDACRELELHPILQAALRDAGHEVRPEVRFPRDQLQRKRSAGSRCDLVVVEHEQPTIWLEVKVVAQFRELGPNRAYASALQHPVWRDVRKLASDPAIERAAVILVLFTSDDEVATHDLEVWVRRAILAGLHLWPRHQRSLPLADRLGHRVCTVAVFPLDRA